MAESEVLPYVLFLNLGGRSQVDVLAAFRTTLAFAFMRQPAPRLPARFHPVRGTGNAALPGN